MLRLFCLVILIGMHPAWVWSQSPEAPKRNVQSWTLTDGKVIDAALVSADEERVSLLVRNTAPIKVFSEASKARIAELAELTPQQLLKQPLQPEAWTSANGKVVLAIFESVRGETVSFLVSKEIPLQTISEASRLQLQVLQDDDGVPVMEIPEVDVPELSLTMEPSVTIDLSTEPEIVVDVKNDAAVLMELDKYVVDANPPETAETTKNEASAQSADGPSPAELAAIAARKKQDAANRLLSQFVQEFKVLYVNRGDSTEIEPAWKARYDDFMNRLDQSRKVGQDDLIAFSSLALAAAALERGDEQAVVTSLVLLSEFLVSSR